MAKLTDVRVGTLQGHFDAGDQPTEGNFDDLISWIQQGIEEHDHSGTGDGDGTNALVGPVGIGVGATAERLTVLGEANTWTARVKGDPTADQSYGLYVQAGSGAADVAFQVKDVTDTTTYLRVRGDGLVSIGNLGGGGNQDVGADNTGQLYVPFVSDLKFKDNIETLTGGLDAVKALRGVTFNWNNEALAKVGLDFGETGQQVGLIAQEVVEVIPLAKSDGKEYKSYDKGMIAPYLIEAIKELDARLTQGGL